MSQQDIRWKQRFQNFSKALMQLTDAINLQQQRPLSKLEKQGFIKAFEFTHELAWKVMKDYFYYQGNTSITGSRDASREAFQNNIITDGDNWMTMIQSRNKAVHSYDETTVNEIIEITISTYHPLFLAFERQFQSFINDR